ncbi:MAG: M28 family peptidase [Caldilineaceae bacterium]
MMTEKPLATPSLSTAKPTRASQTKAMWGPLLTPLFITLVVIAAVVVAVRPLAVPPTLTTSATGGFDITRALQDLEVITVAPRVPGTPAYKDAQSYLVAELEKLGLQPEVTDLISIRSQGNNANVARGSNIVARIPGSASTGAILLGGHLDTVHTTGAASDCGGCAVAVVETARALLAGPQLRNDVILLIEDGEETSRAGSMTFVEQHPWAQNIRVAFNLEAMGAGGASLLYVTGLQNGWLIDEALPAMPAPVAYSFVNDLIWGTGTGGSDLDQFLDVADVGLGLVYLSNVPVYHTMNDSVASLDPATLQHQGATLVSLARHFGNLPLDGTLERESQVYYNLVGHWVIHYPAWVGIVLALVTAAAVLTVIGWGASRGHLRWRGMVVGLLVFVPLVVIATALVSAFWYLLRIADPRLQVFLIGVTYDRELYTVALAIASAGLVLAGYGLLRRYRPIDMGVGVLLWWVLLALLTAFRLPGSSYAVALPALFAVLALWSILALHEQSYWRLLIVTVAGAGAVLFYAPVVNFLGIFSGRAEILMPLPMIALLPALFVALLAGLLLPIFVASGQGQPGRTGIALLAAGLLVIVGIALTAKFNEARPKPNMVAYRVDANAGEAEWITGAANVPGQRASLLDEWTTQFFAAGVEEALYSPWGAFMDDSYPAYRSPAPMVDLPAPTVEVLADSTDGENQRHLQLRFVSPRNAVVMMARLSTSGMIVAATVEDQPMADISAASPSASLNLGFYSVAGDGVTVALTQQEAAPITVMLEDHTYALPAIEGMSIQPRPAWMMPSPTFVSDATLIRQTVTIP